MAYIFPRQKISTAEKNKDSFQWYKDNGLYIRHQANFYSEDRWEMIELYKAAMGDVDPSSYKYVLNPYNTTDENLKNFPARLRNYDIIIPIINLFLGEKADRPFNHQVVCTNPDVPNQQKDELDKIFAGLMAQDFVNHLNASGIKTGVPTQEIPEYKKVLAEYQISATDKRALFGQEALDYIKYDLALKDKFLELMYDWVVVGRVATYKDVYKNDLLYEVVPPLELWTGKTRTGFIEDAPWAYRRSQYNLNDILDRFHEVLKTTGEEGDARDGDQLATLESRFRMSDGMTTNSVTTSVNLDSELDRSNLQDTQTLVDRVRGLIYVEHCVWKGFTKVGILKYQDVHTGNVEEMEVSEEYKLNKENGDIEIEWNWHSIVHELYIIDGDIFLYPRELQVQRNQLSNTSKCKLPYNGRRGYAERNKITSIVKQILPYQVLINIYRYRLELIIAKNKEKLITLPLGLIPDGNGWNEDRAFHFAEATGFLIVDETKPNAVAALNAIKAIDLGLGTYIGQMKELILSIKEEAWDSIGMNRQRYGDVNSSDGKGNNEQAIFRSSVISREMNRRLERFEETELQGLIEYSKAAWIDGKKGAYINSEGRSAFLNVEGGKWLDTDLQVFVIDSQEEASNLKMAKDYAFGIAQKAGVPFSTTIDVIRSNNMSKLKALVEKSEQITREYEQSVAQQEQQAQQALKDAELQKSQQEGQIKLQVEGIKKEAAIEVELIRQDGKADQSTPDTDNYDKGYDEYIKRTQENDKNKIKEGLGAASDIASTRLKEANLKLGKDKLESSEKIAKMNKNKYDK